MVLESWESIQGNQNFLHEALLLMLANSMHKSDHRGAHERLQVIGLKRAESRRVALSSGLCLES